MRKSLLLIAILAFWPCVHSSSVGAAERPPHVVIFLADDLGWRDVGYHGSEIQTPHIDRLSGEGVRLEQFYVLPVCSPTRAALLTGRYPIRHGLQSGVVRPWARYGLPLEERTLPQALHSAGYTTAIVGKWHLGLFEPEYLPTRRGFDHQYGHYNGMIDYFTHHRDGGLDWHRDDKGLREEGYTTELIGREAARLIGGHDPKKPLFLYVPFNAPHSPLQAPESFIDRYKEIENRKRRVYAAMVTCMDEAIGTIAGALKEKGMDRDTLMIFSSDNGGTGRFAGDNTPLRAGKGTLYEGGVRVCAWARWPGVLKPGTVSEPLHIVDWYPTLLKRGGAKREQKLPPDGKDLWPTLTAGKPGPHEEILINAEPQRGALRRGDWKLVVKGKLPRPVGAEGLMGAELFNLEEDPGEKTDRSSENPDKARELLTRLNAYAREALPAKEGDSRRQPVDYKAPKVWGEKE